jgi:hypothetical protein
MNKYYVEFLYPGLIFGDTSSEEVQDEDPKKIEIPERATGFRFYSQTESVTEDNEILRGKKKDYSGWYYKGREMTLEDIKREIPNERILISNMEINKWNRVVKFDCGQYYPLEDKDVVLK